MPRVAISALQHRSNGPIPPVVTPWSAHLFSEGTALYLWQIRHIPNRPQTLLKLLILAVLAAGGGIISFVSSGSVSAQTANASADKKQEEAKPSPAKEFFERVRQELPNHQSVKAKVTQVVSIGDQNFKVDGEYLSAGKKLKLEYTVVPDHGLKGKMLEVCDGKELWTLLELPDSKRVTRRNIQQILSAAVAATKRDVQEATVNVELGLGGLVALLASLDRTMVFDAMKEEDTEGHSQTIVQCRWKKEILQRYPKDKDDSLPVFIPDLVRIYVNTQTMFPEKLLYLKKNVQKKTFRPLVSLEFHNVEFDVPVEDKDFLFQIPPDVVPEDITKQYLDRMIGNAPDSSTGKPNPAAGPASGK
jgi:outer membrane lipoprotein-sorting protein